MQVLPALSEVLGLHLNGRVLDAEVAIEAPPQILEYRPQSPCQCVVANDDMRAHDRYSRGDRPCVHVVNAHDKGLAQPVHADTVKVEVIGG